MRQHTRIIKRIKTKFELDLFNVVKTLFNTLKLRN